MTNQKLNLNIAPSRNLDDNFYFRFEIERDESDFASLEDAANLIDELFGTSICDTQFEIPVCGGSLPGGDRPIPTVEDLSEVVDKELGIESCAALSSTFNAKIRAIRSHIDQEAVIRTEGRVDSFERTTVREDVTRRYEIKNQTQVALDYPLVNGRVKAEWIGSVTNHNGAARRPIIFYENGYLYWNGSTTGVIVVSIPTQYILLDIEIPREGSKEEPDGFETLPEALGAGVTEDVFSGEITLLGFYRFEVSEIVVSEKELQPDVPTLSELCPDARGVSTRTRAKDEPDYCFDLVREVTRCQCSQEIASVGGRLLENEVEVVRDCPEGVTGRNLLKRRTRTIDFVDCGESDGDVGKPSFYEERCCLPPDISLPRCREETRVNPGGQSPSEEVVAEYTARFEPNLVEFVPISPSDGDCGNITKVQIIRRGTCCDEVQPIDVDEDQSSETIPVTGTGTIIIEGGLPPYRVRVSGQGFFVKGGFRDAEVDGREIPIMTINSCGTGVYVISDTCGNSDTARVRSAEGRFEFSGNTFTFDNSPCKYLWVAEGRTIESVSGTPVNARFDPDFDPITGNLSARIALCQRGIRNNYVGPPFFLDPDRQNLFTEWAVSAYWIGGTAGGTGNGWVFQSVLTGSGWCGVFTDAFNSEPLATHTQPDEYFNRTCEADMEWVCS